MRRTSHSSDALHVPSTSAACPPFTHTTAPRLRSPVTRTSAPRPPAPPPAPARGGGGGAAARGAGSVPGGPPRHEESLPSAAALQRADDFRPRRRSLETTPPRHGEER